jgi:hypothetical protein
MKIYKMFGPSLSDPAVIVSRDVPEPDIEAYKQAGYQFGDPPAQEWATAGVVYSLEDSIAQLADEDSTPKKRTKKQISR